MAVSSCSFSHRVFNAYSPFECRSDPDLSGAPLGDKPRVGSTRRVTASSFCPGGGIVGGGLSSLIFRFPPNFVRQLSIKARRNCSNIGVAQIVAASWSNGPASGSPFSAAAAAAQAATAAAPIADDAAIVEGSINHGSVQIGGSDNSKISFLSSDGSITVHAGK